MTPKEARLILRDGGVRSLIECSGPAEGKYFNDEAHFKRLNQAYKNLQTLIRRIAKRK